MRKLLNVGGAATCWRFTACTSICFHSVCFLPLPITPTCGAAPCVRRRVCVCVCVRV